ncbi:hypothetical protein BJX62DRAFT_236938 [Aspergillus germanicus]
MTEDYVPILPECLKRLPVVPPMCLFKEGDSQAIQVLRKFGTELGCPNDEITQACNLASGFSDVVVILQRPLEENLHPYNQPFDKFVSSNPTLKVVDELLRFASAGARSIYTTTVINAFPFQKDKKDAEADRRCEEVIAKFLQIKRPRIIIQCVNPVYVCPSMMKFNFEGKPSRLEYQKVPLESGHICTVIPSFHPSYATKYNPYRPEWRVLQMYHFVMAFRYLHGEDRLPCCAEKIQRMCLTKDELNSNDNRPAVLASRISKKLFKSYLPRRNTIPLPSEQGFAEETDFEMMNRESEIFEILAAWLALLLRKPQAFEPFGILYTLILLPNANFLFPFISSRIATALSGSDLQHDHWSCDDNDISVIGVGKELSEMGLTHDEVFPTIIDANTQAYQAASGLLNLVDRGESIDFTKISSCSKALNSQDLRLYCYFKDKQSIAISHTLRVAALSKRCKTIVDTMNKHSQSIENSEWPLYLHCLLDCLRKVRIELELCQA